MYSAFFLFPERLSRPALSRLSAAARGIAGEALAARCIRRKGLTIIARNWRNEHREIDLVAVDGKTAVFIEVKTRSARAAQSFAALDSIHRKKRESFIACANSFITEHEAALKRRGIRAMRFDIVTVELPAPEPRARSDRYARVEHFESAL
jgi:putative endonuclease